MRELIVRWSTAHRQLGFVLQIKKTDLRGCKPCGLQPRRSVGWNSTAVALSRDFSERLTGDRGAPAG